MDFTDSRVHRDPDPSRIRSAKIVIAGGFGVGKTTMVGSVSEIEPLTTEAIMTSAGAGYDNLSGLPDKNTTTVAMDFGRITIGSDLILYLFGAPGQTRFWFMWDQLQRGAIGAVVLADVRRLPDCFPSIDFFEHRHVPYLVAVNLFDGAPRYPEADLRDALTVSDHIPLMLCDARDRESSKSVLIALVTYAIELHRRSYGAMSGQH